MRSHPFFAGLDFDQVLKREVRRVNTLIPRRGFSVAGVSALLEMFWRWCHIPQPCGVRNGMLLIEAPRFSQPALSTAAQPLPMSEALSQQGWGGPRGLWRYTPFTIPRMRSSSPVAGSCATFAPLVHVLLHAAWGGEGPGCRCITLAEQEAPNLVRASQAPVGKGMFARFGVFT